MKYIIFITAILLYCLQINAQNVVEKSCNIFRTGDVLMKHQVEFKSPGRGGANVLWDFSKQKLINNQYKVSYPHYSDSLIISQEQRTLFKYLLQGDSLLFTGLENSTTLLNYHYPELQLVYPVHYGDSREDYFRAIGDYCGQLNLNVKGKSGYHADAYGIIMLPEDVLLENVLRIHHTRKEIEKQTPQYSFLTTDTIFSSDSIDCYLSDTYKQTDTYRWYAEGYRYPVFETINVSVYSEGKIVSQNGTSFYYPPHEQNYGLENDPENQEKREKMAMEKEKIRQQTEENKDGLMAFEKGIFNYNAFINKEKSELIIEYHLQQTNDITFRLFDIQGKLISQQSKERKDSGYYALNIPINGNTIKEYLLQIIVDEKTYGEKILNN